MPNMLVDSDAYREMVEATIRVEEEMAKQFNELLGYAIWLEQHVAPQNMDAVESMGTRPEWLPKPTCDSESACPRPKCLHERVQCRDCGEPMGLDPDGKGERDPRTGGNNANLD